MSAILKKPFSIRDRNKFAQSHAKLVHKIVHRMVHKCNEPYEDLYQVGYMGLLKAVERFEESLGNAFSSFAVPYIEGEIRHYLRDQAPALKMPRSAMEKAAHIKRLRKHFMSLNRQLNEKQIASKVGIDKENWRLIEQVSSGAISVSWDELVCEPKIEIEEETEDLHGHVYSAIAQLSPIYRQLIRDRYFLGKSITQIANTRKLSQAFVEAGLSEAIYHLNIFLSKNYASN